MLNWQHAQVAAVYMFFLREGISLCRYVQLFIITVVPFNVIQVVLTSRLTDSPTGVGADCLEYGQDDAG